jgi:hypothetical protein
VIRQFIAAVAIVAALVAPAAALNLEQAPQRATAAAGAATLNSPAGTITTESLSTAAGATYTLTLQNGNIIQQNSVVLVSIANGSNAAGDPSLQLVTPGNGKVVVTVVNRHATNAFNGTLLVSFVVFN